LFIGSSVVGLDEDTIDVISSMSSGLLGLRAMTLDHSRSIVCSAKNTATISSLMEYSDISVKRLS
jgi:hypothetical protein